MKITITLMNNDNKIDYMVNDELFINTALMMINQHDYFFENIEDCIVYSKRNQRSINVHFTFKQENIYSGDILEVASWRNLK